MALMSVWVGAGEKTLAELSSALGLDFARSDWQRRDPDSTADWEHHLPAEELWWENYVVQASSLAEARAVLPLLRSEGKSRRLILVIGTSPADAPAEGNPAPGNSAWTPRRLQDHATHARMMVPGVGLAVVIEGGAWVTVHTAALAALRTCSEADRAPALGGLRVGITNTVDRSWLAGDPHGSFMTERLLQPEADDIYAADIVVGSARLVVLPGRQTPPVWPAGDLLPPVDTAVISPMGFRPLPDQGPTVLDPRDLAAAREFSELDVAALRGHQYLTVDGPQFAGQDAALARRLTQLAVAGVPVIANGLSATVRSMIGEKLAARIDVFAAQDDVLARESKSIDMRRTALDLYSPRGRWNMVLGEVGRAPAPETSVSVLLASRRPDKLASAFAQLGRQSWKATEVVLVLHGVDPERPEVRQAVNSYPGDVTVRAVPADTLFGEALNAGVEAASGELISKMDDDDWYGEHHLRDLVRAREFSGATLVGSQVEFVYLESLDITTRRPPAGEQYTDHVAGGTMTISRAELRDLGGWRPVHRAVDRCLLQSVQAAGGLIYRTHGQNYLMHRHSGTDSHGGHTWNPDDSVFLQSIAGQWDGFRPPPQLKAAHAVPEAVRNNSLRSYFARPHTSAPDTHSATSFEEVRD